ncbi:hypothetical protein [Laspinema palackyanum]|uniref:hypothetical protein n=1 Tax=Laspinema palackyanum TaxID=3231601 RepID=UPI00345C9C2C|nr:hypothetical protein [Laspinema sp. D2c]
MQSSQCAEGIFPGERLGTSNCLGQAAIVAIGPGFAILLTPLEGWGPDQWGDRTEVHRNRPYRDRHRDPPRKPS